MLDQSGDAQMIRSGLSINSETIFCVLLGVCVASVTGSAVARDQYSEVNVVFPAGSGQGLTLLQDSSPRWAPRKIVCEDNGDFAYALSDHRSRIGTYDELVTGPLEFMDPDKGYEFIRLRGSRFDHHGWIQLERIARTMRAENWQWKNPEHPEAQDFSLSHVNKILNHYWRNIDRYYDEFITDQILIAPNGYPREALDILSENLTSLQGDQVMAMSDYGTSTFEWRKARGTKSWEPLTQHEWSWRKKDSADGREFVISDSHKCRYRPTENVKRSEVTANDVCAYDLDGNQYSVALSGNAMNYYCSTASDGRKTWNLPGAAKHPIVFVYGERYALFDSDGDYVATVLRRLNVTLPTFEKFEERPKKPAF